MLIEASDCTPPMITLVSERARTGMTLALLFLATGRGADNAVPDLRLTLDARADTIVSSPCRYGQRCRFIHAPWGQLAGKVLEISYRSLRATGGINGMASFQFRFGNSTNFTSPGQN